MMKRLLLLLLLLFFSSPAWASWTTISSTHTESINGGPPTTAGINTTGANTIIVGVTGVASCPITTIHDNKNPDGLWNLVQRNDVGGGTTIDIWEASSSILIVGTGHTFTATRVGACNSLNAIFVQAWVDGVPQTVTSVAHNGAQPFWSTVDNIKIMADDGDGLYLAGSVSMPAQWSIALSDGQVAALAACGDPASISPDNYWPINQTSPEVAAFGGIDLTVHGTTNSASPCSAAPSYKPGLMLNRMAPQ